LLAYSYGLGIMNKLYKHIPESSGVYIMKDTLGRILYIGKAVNLKRRVSSYFRARDIRIERLMNRVKSIAYKRTASALEALILEANLIKKHQPEFNILEKDDTSFLYVVITKEEFPRVLTVRGKELRGKESEYGKVFGSFLSSASLKEALRIIRKILPWSTHSATHIKKTISVGKPAKACFEYQIGLCPGTCMGAISRKEYAKNIKNIELILSGRIRKVVTNLREEMKTESNALEFEKAEKAKRHIFSLEHIQDISLISNNAMKRSENVNVPVKKIEGFDISNISGNAAVGAMVVFERDTPKKSEYKRFRIKTVNGPDDTGMMREMLVRRFNHKEWRLPNLILVDGGAGQVNTAREVLEKQNIKIPVVGIAKGAERKKNEFIGTKPKWADEKILIKVRDEAHRFAINYHRKRRNDMFMSK